jgi:hypothetical protein
MKVPMMKAKQKVSRLKGDVYVCLGIAGITAVFSS